MDNTELLTQVEAEQSKEREGSADYAEKLVKFLIVQIQEKTYAFYAEHIKEIVMDVPLYYVPFVPHYIRGFINRHGEPYTAFDLHALFEGKLLESITFLISNFQNDQIAFLVSNVIEILKVPESQVHLLSSKEDRDTFFLGAVSTKGAEVFILNLATILERLEYDLESS